MGGITVLPSRTVSEVNTSDVAVFILPGGDRWENASVEPELEEYVREQPIKSLLMAAGVGVLLGILWKRS